jgi:hypothetical protein
MNVARLAAFAARAKWRVRTADAIATATQSDRGRNPVGSSTKSL